MIRKEDCKNMHSWIGSEACEVCFAYWRICMNCTTRQLVDRKGTILKTVTANMPKFIKTDRRKK